MRRRAVLFAGCSGAALAASAALRPHRRASEQLGRVDLDTQVPQEFGGWTIDKSLIPILPNPEAQAKLDKIYTQVLARTYVRSAGERVMLSIAYGADQGSDAASVHRPEFCYSAQGFEVRGLGQARISLNGHVIEVRRLLGTLGTRIESIMYWVTLSNRTVLPGVERKIEQVRLGLSGVIPDGMLVRISTIDSDLHHAFATQSRFASSLAQSLSKDVRSRYIGADA
jgi:EpsI family protein